MATSYTGTINTNGEFIDLATESGVTFTSGKSYTMQIQNSALLKIEDAVFSIYNEKFNYTASSNTIYIKTEEDARVVILEN